MKVLKQAYPYRYCESDQEDSGWIDKFNMTTRKYQRMYDCDSPLQLMTAMEDYNYTLWLDPEDIPCYRENRGDVVVSPYKK
jgi:hypothetical protein